MPTRPALPPKATDTDTLAEVGAAKLLWAASALVLPWQQTSVRRGGAQRAVLTVAPAAAARLLQLHLSVGCWGCGGQLRLDGVVLAPVQQDRVLAPEPCPRLAAPLPPPSPPAEPRPDVVQQATAEGVARAAGLAGADLTIVTQLSLERLEMLHQLALAWRGPVAASVYIPCPEGGSSAACRDQHPWQLAYLKKKVEQALAAAAVGSSWAVLVLLETRPGAPYPINRLRNAALAAASTAWAIVLDADFVPSPTLGRSVAQALGHPLLARQDRLALVVPAFDLRAADRLSGPALATKDEVLTASRAGTVRPFRLDATPRSHGATDFARWATATDPYYIRR